MRFATHSSQIKSHQQQESRKEKKYQTTYLCPALAYRKVKPSEKKKQSKEVTMNEWIFHDSHSGARVVNSARYQQRAEQSEDVRRNRWFVN
jgi:hypothetical protein